MCFMCVSKSFVGPANHYWNICCQVGNDQDIFLELYDKDSMIVDIASHRTTAMEG